MCVTEMSGSQWKLALNSILAADGSFIEINNINSAEVEGIRRSVSEKRIR